jgi:nitrogen fixation-related uncharacterized protein
MDFGCAAYCRYAEQCLGDLPPELAARQEDLLKDRVAITVKRRLKTDFARIGHITRRARHAEAIAGENNAGTKLPVVLITAFLWGLDTADNADDVPVARSILADVKAPPPLVERVCKVLTQRNSATADETDIEFKIVADAEQQALKEEAQETTMACGCPSTRIQSFSPCLSAQMKAQPTGEASALSHWPVQIKLVPPHAPFLKGADLLVVADCVPVAFPSFHQELLQGKAIMIGCPKFDDADEYIEKFAAIFNTSGIKSLTTVVMEVPCCSGLPMMVLKGREKAGSQLPINQVVVGTRGRIIEERQVA